MNLNNQHIYLSTACLHEKHDQCRLKCKFCETTCLCECHDDESAIKFLTPADKVMAELIDKQIAEKEMLDED